MPARTLSEAIKLEKAKSGLMSKVIISESGVGKTQFYRIINGEFLPPIETKKRIAKSLNISVEQFDVLFKQSALERNETDHLNTKKKISLKLSALLLCMGISIATAAFIWLNVNQSNVEAANKSPSSLQDSTLFIKDVTIPDGSVLPINTRFEKTWRVKNTGSVVWKDRYLMRVTPQSDLICSSPNFVPIPETKPGQTVDITVTFTTPRVPGTCKTIWKSADKLGNLHFPKMHGLFSFVQVIEEQN